MFSKFTEFSKSQRILGILIRSKLRDCYRKFDRDRNTKTAFLPVWIRKCDMSSGSERKNVPCPCVPANKIRKYKKKRYEKCERPTPCPSVKHKCDIDKCVDTKQKCSSDDQ